MTSEIPHADMFDGNITLRFIRNVEITARNAAARNSEKRSRQLDLNPACADSTRVNNGTAAGPGVRKAMGFLYQSHSVTLVCVDRDSRQSRLGLTY